MNSSVGVVYFFYDLAFEYGLITVIVFIEKLKLSGAVLVQL